MLRKLFLVTLAAALVGTLAIIAGCGGGSNSTPDTMGFVNTTVSDPATCQAPNGPFSHVWVTVTDVQINASSSAGNNDSGWMDLTPGLKPTQVDLLGQANTECFLAMLGSKTALQAGQYQQIRIMLLANNNASQISGTNPCGSVANCVVLASNSSVKTLDLSSEAQTGIKIPSGQIAGGAFVVAAGQTEDLDVDFNACASIIPEPNGNYRLKPVLHAGEVGLSSAITGQVVVSGTTNALAGGNVMVALEQVDQATGIDRVIMATDADSTGKFIFCPVPTGTYDIVAVGIDGSNVAYAATVTTGVAAGTAMGTIPLVAETGTNTSQGTITGQITTTTGSAGTQADIRVAALLPVDSMKVIIPLVQNDSALFTLTTAAGTCPTNTDCGTYTLDVPAANPNVGAFSSSGTQYTQASGSPTYTVDAQAFVTGQDTQTDCSTSEMNTSVTSTNTPLTVTAGVSVTAQTIPFSGCQ